MMPIAFYFSPLYLYNFMNEDFIDKLFPAFEPDLKHELKENSEVIRFATQYFADVPEDVWAFHVGGYQVCQKWLKDRKGRTLSFEDLHHYQGIVAALGDTIRIMAEIDQVIEIHGGWPLK